MSKLVEMNYDQIHDFVNKNKSKGFFWDQYTVVKWSPGNKGYMQTNGLYRNGKWGYASKFSMTNKGTWLIPINYVTNT